MNGIENQISVSNLWKVFGRNPERALEQDNLLKTRAETQRELELVVALRDVSFTVTKGEVFVVMGLSGSGKSTLVRCLCRLIDSTGGEVVVDGENVQEYDESQLIEYRRKKIAMVFQHFGLLPHRKVIDNVAYGLEVQGLGKQERYELAIQVIDKVGLRGWENSYPNELSGGMQQRVGLARALAVDPEILLMDEPFSGLDPLIRREMQDELVLLQKDLNKTVIFITHDLDEALKLGSRIAIMRDGEIIQLGTPEEIVTQPKDDYVADFVQDVSKAKVLLAGTIMKPSAFVLCSSQKPQDALQMLDSNNATSSFLTAESGRLMGILTDVSARSCLDQNMNDLTEAKVNPAASALMDEKLDKLITLASTIDHPIAILESDGRLLGEVSRETILTTLAGDDR